MDLENLPFGVFPNANKAFPTVEELNKISKSQKEEEK